jgi:hypothetical protein
MSRRPEGIEKEEEEDKDDMRDPQPTPTYGPQSFSSVVQRQSDKYLRYM